jgi:hypothetical protein
MFIACMRVAVRVRDTRTSAADEAAWPALSNARAVTVCVPLLSPASWTRLEYGARVSVATRRLSTQNSTRLIALPEVASALNRTLRPIVELAAGAVRVTVGAAGVLGAAGALGVSTGSTTVHDALAPGLSTLPAASVERMVTVCEPMASPDTVYGLVHAVHAPPSRRHCEVAPLSSTLKLIAPLLESESAGGDDVMVVVGATVSTVNDRVAGEGSVLPAASVARTLTVRLPSGSAGAVQGLVHPT